MFLPDFIVLLCQGVTVFHIGSFILSRTEKAKKSTSTSTPQTDQEQPSSTESDTSTPSTMHHPTFEPDPASSPGPDSIRGGGPSPFRTPNTFFIRPDGSEPFMDEPCITSTPIKPRNRKNPYHDANAVLKHSKQPSTFETPSPCAFFSNPNVENVEQTRILWRRRLELAKKRGGVRMTPSKSAELRRKVSYIQKMQYIEAVRWEIPSEFDQYLFLLQMQPKGDDCGERGEARLGDDDSEGKSEDEISQGDIYAEPIPSSGIQTVTVKGEEAGEGHAGFVDEYAGCPFLEVTTQVPDHKLFKQLLLNVNGANTKMGRDRAQIDSKKF